MLDNKLIEKIIELVEEAYMEGRDDNCRNSIFWEKSSARINLIDFLEENADKQYRQKKCKCGRITDYDEYDEGKDCYWCNKSH